MSFPASYHGKCSDCGERYPEGAEITKTDGGYAHVDCGEVDEPKPVIEGKACPRCWLRHPEGACDRA